ncbi:mycofactocin biosynthesis chaperone MftB [Hoyosella altamirensis]|uniref:Putative mycofactocin binding protein MftB n=1 Tax=Hoyosella altamirensis TaxID=616997 RepID=A0A839RPD1_9ACTN|nr:mycofactocin biosynthesis chaperone MftB [Hoyosella altamirensis]MBB3038380.1 putative mycofactocin binding protein MftB [Hoyosella altamirensis]
MECAASTETERGAEAFDPHSRYALSASVSVRPEPFGALLYDFHTRRLAFLKSPQLVTVVRTLHNHSSVHAALSSAGVHTEDQPHYLHALAGLAATGTITNEGHAR